MRAAAPASPPAPVRPPVKPASPALTSGLGRETSTYGAQKFVDRERSEGANLRAAAGAEGDGHARDRGCVGGIDDVDEVVLAERRPLVDDPRAELLDVVVDLAQPVRIRLQR